MAVSFSLSIPTVITPSSLQVVSGPSQNLLISCQIPSGDLTNVSSGNTLYRTRGMRSFTGITPLAHRLVSSTIMGQRILPLPQPCGLNCTYSVSVPSFAFECQDGVQLPAEMSSNKRPLSAVIWNEPFWNATVNPTVGINPPTSLYVYWKSRTESGTNGTALCTVGGANYDFTVSGFIIPVTRCDDRSAGTNPKRATVCQLQRYAYRAARHRGNKLVSRYANILPICYDPRLSPW